MVERVSGRDPNMTLPSRHAWRTGFTILELLVSITTLVTVMTLTTTLCFQIQRTWQDIRQRQIAVGELSNQLERLTQLDPEQLKAELENLEASTICEQSLRRPELFGVASDDELGTRIVLSIDWRRRHPAKPIQLTGWLNPKSTVLEAESND